MTDGRLAGSATVGRDGVAAMSASGHVDDAFTRFVVRLPGDGCRATTAAFEQMIDGSVAFHSAVTHWRAVFARIQIRSAACKAPHNVRQRLTERFRGSVVGKRNRECTRSPHLIDRSMT